MVVSQFTDQLTGNLALNDTQQAQLVQAMSDARSGYKWTTDFNQQNPASGDFTQMFTEDKLNQFATEKEQFDQQFLTQAGKILTPDQLTQFQQFQKTQRDMQMMGLKMASQMFAPKNQ
jgi:hypothetical protein